MGRDKDVRSARRRFTAAATITTIALGLATAPAALAGDSSIVGAWLLDEGTGQKVRDISGKGNHGMLGTTSGADSSDPSWFTVSAGRYYTRNALSFDGDDSIAVADSTTLEPSNISVGAIVRSKTPGQYRYVVSKGALQCQTASYGLYTGADGGLIFYISNGTETVLSPDATARIWDGNWHIVLGTFDGGRVRLYVDGREIGTGTTTNVSLAYSFPTNDNFYIGDYRGSCSNPLGFMGDIDAVAVANKAINWNG